MRREPDADQNPRPLPRLEVLGGPETMPDDEIESEDLGLTVLLTGANGRIGRKLSAAWADRYDLIQLDLPADGLPSEIVPADLSIWDDQWPSLLEGVDVVVHLAANPDPNAAWADLVRPNLDAMANILHAAAFAGVDRFVFASSNHVMGGYRHLSGPITEDLPPLPDGPYGASKLMGERLGAASAAAFEMEFLALRLGWSIGGTPAQQARTPAPDDWTARMWISDADLIQLFERAVEIPLQDRDILIFNATSANAGSRWSLDRARALLGFEPQHDFANREAQA